MITDDIDLFHLLALSMDTHNAFILSKQDY